MFAQLADMWKGELMATGELNTMLNKWLSRATLDIIGEGRVSFLSYAVKLAMTYGIIAAFNYDYNGLDGGERSSISKGYDDIL